MCPCCFSKTHICKNIILGGHTLSFTCCWAQISGFEGSKLSFHFFPFHWLIYLFLYNVSIVFVSQHIPTSHNNLSSHMDQKSTKATGNTTKMEIISTCTADCLSNYRALQDYWLIRPANITNLKKFNMNFWFVNVHLADWVHMPMY